MYKKIDFISQYVMLDCVDIEMNRNLFYFRVKVYKSRI